LRLLADLGVESVHAHDVSLANAARAGLGLPPGDSAMVSLELEPDFDKARLEGLRTSYRAGRLRVAFHLYNSAQDVERLVTAIAG
jgi:selenocysteine lyase/cysteine desulfurase